MTNTRKRIAFIAMSGVRINDPELLKAGLNLPGFVERSEVIASLPSLSLLTLAALTPDEFDIEYHEIRHLQDGDKGLRDLPQHFDLVAISSFTAQIKDAYRVADFYRAQGIPVVLGGLHVTALPDEAATHATSIIVGEGEPLWPSLIHDFANDTLKKRYESSSEETYDLANAPIPRFDLLDIRDYNRLTVQTVRGCPHCCEFCASSPLLTSGYSLKPVKNVIQEIRAIKSVFPNPFVEFADDNSFASRSQAYGLLTELAKENIKWFTESDISIADDPKLLSLMKKSGCRQVLVGLESPTSSGLDGLEVRRNWKLQQFDRYERAIEIIQSHGITVNGCFILGLDNHTEEIFDSVYDFVNRTGLYEVQITVLTPFPGTALYDRLLREDRIIEKNAWEKCTLFDVNFKPRLMTPKRLQQGLLELMQRLYEPAFIKERRDRFFQSVKSGVRPGAA